MSITTTLVGALALLIPTVPSAASAQEAGYPYGPGYAYEVQYAPPEPATTALTIVPPAYVSVYVYDGRRLVSRFDGSGAIWLPTGRLYRVVAMRGDQVVWSGTADAAGAPIELRWPAPRAWYPPTPSPYATPPRVLTPPVEMGRVRTPLP